MAPERSDSSWRKTVADDIFDHNNSLPIQLPVWVERTPLPRGLPPRLILHFWQRRKLGEMLVSHQRQFIYTKTIKTAGTSVEVYFEPYCRDDDGPIEPYCNERVSDAGIVGYRGPDHRGQRWYNHMSAKKIRQLVGDQAWSNYFKFCVIRNPFEKLVSAFHFYEWLVDHSSGWMRRKLILQHGLFPRANQDDCQRFRKWVAWTWWFNDRRHYMIGKQLCMDFLIRYENLVDDVRAVCQRLSIPFEPERIPRLNAGINPKTKSVAKYYDRKTVDIVKRRFRFELDYFQYEFPSHRGSAT